MCNGFCVRLYAVDRNAVQSYEKKYIFASFFCYLMYFFYLVICICHFFIVSLHPIMNPIAYAHNGFTDKFGIPRQVRAHSALRTRIVFCPPYRSDDAIRGIETFSHLWIIWEFHAASGHTPSLTVRPPRLGGNTRIGVFATRSPYRPNPIGLTSVRLVSVEHDPKDGPVLVVEGADMMDGTPIYDIKPYLGYCDSHADARDGFVDTTPLRVLPVKWPEILPNGLPVQELQEILEQDPRPAYHNDPERVYGIDYAGWNIHFRVDAGAMYITGIKARR